ncbi:MAG TPA: hypothetical protein VFT82_00680, partial [Candidatus Paceibacterota bacterium]|nr:hypothetical protein [Candidatus Paceibacterota bacterium]
MKKQKVFRMIGKIFTFGFFGFSLMLPAGMALAANDYVPLTTIPGAFTENQTVNPVDVVKNIYGVSIGIAALLAV